MIVSGVNSVLVSQKGSGRLGLGVFSFSLSSSDPLLLGVNSSEDFNKEHMDESGKNIVNVEYFYIYISDKKKITNVSALDHTF